MLLLLLRPHVYETSQAQEDGDTDAVGTDTSTALFTDISAEGIGGETSSTALADVFSDVVGDDSSGASLVEDWDALTADLQSATGVNEEGEVVWGGSAFDSFEDGDADASFS